MAYFRCSSGGGGGGVTPPTTGSFQGSAGLVKEISVEKKPTSILFWASNVSSNWAETNVNNKHYAERGIDSVVVAVGSSQVFYLTVQSVTSSMVTVKLPTNATFAEQTWNYIFFYKD